MEKIKMEIAGEISLSEDPGATMRKWREIFGISQVELANLKKSEELRADAITVDDFSQEEYVGKAVEPVALRA